MTTEQQQDIVDRVMRTMALRHGSSSRRDFEVACLVIEMIGSGNQAADAEHSDTTSRSAAQKADAQ